MDLSRYHRQMLLPEVGLAGQESLLAARVLLVGVGGLGSPVALYLAAAGVGTLGLVDPDTVDVSNLHRQILYGTDDVGRLKVDAAADRLRQLNPTTEIVPHAVRLDATTADALIAPYDVVVDGTDTFATRYAVNDASVRTGTPNVYASVNRFDGQASVFGTPDGPCYRCLFPEQPPPGLVPSCAEGGVLGVLPGLLGTIQATEVLKLLLDLGETLAGRLLLVDALTLTTRSLQIDRDPQCPMCGSVPQTHDATARRAKAPILAITPVALQERLQQDDAPFLLDVRGDEERAAGHIGGMHLPLNQLPWRLDELESVRSRAPRLVVYCRSGARSAQAVEYLMQNGFPDAVTLQGGLLAWKDAIDASIVVV